MHIVHSHCHGTHQLSQTGADFVNHAALTARSMSEAGVLPFVVNADIKEHQQQLLDAILSDSIDQTLSLPNLVRDEDDFSDDDMRGNVDATVTSRTGSANAPLRIISPSTPTEKSPLTGFVPEWSPLTDCT